MFKSIFTTLANCLKIPELKSRMIFTLVVLAICRVVSLIQVPGLDGHLLKQYFDSAAQKDGGMLGLYSMFTGGALERCAIGSLGIMPYISATIIIQLLSAVIPTLSKLAREEGGRAKIIQYGRYLTVLLCLGQGLVMSIAWENPEKIFQGFSGTLVLSDNLWWYRIQTTLVLTTGTLLLMWLGEQITERGIGNGISLVITIGILARMPQTMMGLKDMFIGAPGLDPKYNFFHGVALVMLLLGVIAAVIAVTQAQRKIPVQYAQRTVGRKQVQGGSSFMPLRVNYTGVMPIIFAQAILMFPEKLLQMLGKALDIKFLEELSVHFREDQIVHMLLYAVMILFFCYFWVATQFNELQIADDLKKYGGYIPGVRPGTATSDFLHNTMSRITLAGAVFLIVIAIIPQFMTRSLGIPYYVSQFFGGTSILITVGVVLDTMRMMESHLLMRHYDGFLRGTGGRKGPKLRGRL